MEDIKSVLPTLSNKNLTELIKCVNFAAIKHKNQRRNDLEATPYINHPIGNCRLREYSTELHQDFDYFLLSGVANILTEEGGIYDIDVIEAAILHDTVEDTDTTFEEIEENFGPKVRGIVAEVTDDKNLPKMERKRQQVKRITFRS